MARKLTVRVALTALAVARREALSTDEIVDLVLARTRGRTPRAGEKVLCALQQHPHWLPVGEQHWLPLWDALDGLRFRIRPSPRELETRTVLLDTLAPFDRALCPAPAGTPRAALPGQGIAILDSAGQPIPVLRPDPSVLQEMLTARLRASAVASSRAIGHPLSAPRATSGGTASRSNPSQDSPTSSPGLRGLLLPLLCFAVLAPPSFPDRLQPGGSLLVTLHGRRRAFTLAWEPPGACQELTVRRQDRELAEALATAVAQSAAPLDSGEVLFRTYHQFPWARVYPGSPWREVVERDPRLALIVPEFLGYPLIASAELVRYLAAASPGRRPDPAPRRPLAPVVPLQSLRLLRALRQHQSRWEAAFAQASLSLGLLGARPAATPSRPPAPADRLAASAASEAWLRQFAEGLTSAATPPASQARKLEAGRHLADFLATYWRASLPEATLSALEAYFCDHCLREASMTPARIQQLAADILDLYRWGESRGWPAGTAPAELFFRLRELLGERVSLHHEVAAQPEGVEADLLARLYGQHS